MTKLESLKLKLSSIHRKSKAAEKRVCVLRREESSVMDAIHFEEMRALMSLPDAVKYRFSDSPLGSDMGTITEIKRTRATVICRGKSWNVPICDLIPAGDPQGFTVSCS